MKDLQAIRDRLEAVYYSIAENPDAEAKDRIDAADSIAKINGLMQAGAGKPPEKKKGVKIIQHAQEKGRRGVD